VAAPGAVVASPPASDDVAALLQREVGGEITIREEVRRNAFTAVYAGIETRQSRPVHVHVVLPDAATADRDRAQRTLRAARASSKLRHPRVTPVYRVAAGDRLCWYVTPPDTGEALATVVGRAGPLPLDRVTDIVQQIAAALACAHEQRIVHGALSPAAIVLDDNGGASVRDFGLPAADAARMREYRAPELDAMGPGASLTALTGMSAAADQYALGILAWQMLTGSTPFAGIAAAMPGSDDRRLPPLSAVRPDLPAAVGTVLERATASRPSDRYPMVGKFAQSLRAAAEGRPSAPARPALRPRESSGVLLAPEGPAAPPPIVQLPDEKPPRRTARRPVILGALGGATALALVALLAWRSNSDDAITPAERARLEAAARFYGAQPASAEEPLVAPPDRPTPEPSPSPSPAPTTAPAAKPAKSPVESPHQAAQRRQREAQQRREAAPSRAISAATAWVTIGTNPQASIFINETPVPTNPVINWPVKAGQVFLRFEVLDASSGVWTRDMTVNVAAGDTLNLRRIRLTRP
jgi:serine/threonine protein kinase